jgi:hypothetical protein
MKLIQTTDHRVTSKPWQKRKHSIAEKRFGIFRKGYRRSGTVTAIAVPLMQNAAGSKAGHSYPNVGDTGFHICANLTIGNESTDSAAVPVLGSRTRVNQFRNMMLAGF